jgi:GT2 family glycosyltransferase
MTGISERRVTVVIPTWKRKDLLQNCLHSIDQQYFRDFVVIVVSNGAGDEAERLAEAAGCTIIRLPSNRGFAAAVNAGIAHGQSPYVLVLNDDVELDPRWLERTVAFLDEHPEISYCCGKIYQADGALLDNAGDALSLGGSAWRLGYGRPGLGGSPPNGATLDGNGSGSFDFPRPVWAVSATATLFRRTAFDWKVLDQNTVNQTAVKKIGGFDEDYFAYLEDMDFSLHAARAGLRGYYLPAATSRHWGSATLGGPDSAAVIRLLTQNQLLLLAKQFPTGLLLRLAPRIVWAQILWAMLAVRKLRFGAYLAGLAGFLRLLPAAIRGRPQWRTQDVQIVLARLRASEREIYADVTSPERTERDAFWRLYFALFPLRGKPEAVEQSLRTAP